MRDARLLFNALHVLAEVKRSKASEDDETLGSTPGAGRTYNGAHHAHSQSWYARHHKAKRSRGYARWFARHPKGSRVIRDAN